VNTIKLDFECCTGCKSCFKTCFVNVYRWDDSLDRPVIAYPEDCVECNKCELSCPEECIQVIPDYEHNYWPPVV
jgi:NAD-dependent dihydropyrimidine dehydrogenase PreA subunit